MNDLLKIAASLGHDPIKRGMPPVEKWTPQFCGEMDLLIRRDGIWVHEGRPITRPQLVQLFASVLKREGDDYFLVTPVEKLHIQVEDVPFIINRLDIEGEGSSQTLMVTTNLGELFALGSTHPLSFHPYRDEILAPYSVVRRNLMARFSRTAWFDLANLAICDEKSEQWGVYSDNIFFSFPSVDG